MEKTILITGGLGYIGSHLIFNLLSYQHDIIVLDNKSNNYVDEIQGTTTYIGDLNDVQLLQKIFKKHSIDCIIHLAAKKSVEESKTHSLDYYIENVSNTLNLLKYSNCKNIIFASSASVYGDNDCCHITSTLHPNNPYAQTKVMCEQILKDIYDSTYNITILRIFNPIGYVFNGKLGENLLDKICRAIQDKSPLTIFNQGNDVRDFIYIEDVVRVIIKSIDNCGFNICNVGTGQGTSTNEILSYFPEIKDLIVYNSTNHSTKLISDVKTKNTRPISETIDHIRKVKQI
jgi:UDP-glucose 4-epimerase